MSLPPLLWIAITPEVARCAQVALLSIIDSLPEHSPTRPRMVAACAALREAVETSVAEAGATESARAAL